MKGAFPATKRMQFWRRFKGQKPPKLVALGAVDKYTEEEQRMIELARAKRAQL